jgi:hypothetical protein
MRRERCVCSFSETGKYTPPVWKTATLDRVPLGALTWMEIVAFCFGLGLLPVSCLLSLCIFFFLFYFFREEVRLRFLLAGRLCMTLCGGGGGRGRRRCMFFLVVGGLVYVMWTRGGTSYWVCKGISSCTYITHLNCFFGGICHEPSFTQPVAFSLSIYPFSLDEFPQRGLSLNSSLPSRISTYEVSTVDQVVCNS